MYVGPTYTSALDPGLHSQLCVRVVVVDYAANPAEAAAGDPPKGIVTSYPALAAEAPVGAP
jgi:hypothetical protein